MTYDAWPSSADGEVFITKKKTTDQIDLVSIPWATAKADDLSVLGDAVLLTAGDYTVTFVCNASYSGGSYVNPETNETGSGNYDRYLVIDSLQLYMLGELATVDGAAVRIEEPMGIRFISSIPKSLAEDVVEYGTMLIPTAMLGDEELSSETESVAIVPAEKLYKVTDSAYQFTAVLYNIPYSAYKTEITARAYAKLSDGSYIYGNTTARSIYRVAELGLENPNATAQEKATFEAIIANAQ
ncbi:MAG: hypothetical protein E7471_03340 [Ruminococcaceae bacterium]|nr:hypothetical protein [Oscillospiraceae bacterium]